MFHILIMIDYLNMENRAKESAGVVKRTFSFIRVRAKLLIVNLVIYKYNNRQK